MLRAIDHINIVVSDLERSVKFYTEVLGFKKTADVYMEGEWIETIIGLRGVKGYVSFVEGPGGGPRIELLEYRAPAGVSLPENSKAIASAREHGDLKENSEYKMAKQDQQVLMAQKTLLEKDLGRARVTDFKEASTDQVSAGTVVEVRSGASGTTTTYTILGAWDGDPDKHIISYKTALGAALLGKKPGETVKVKLGGNDEEYSVVKITRVGEK